MAIPDFNRYDHIECPLPTQKDQQRVQTIKVLEKDDLSLLKIKRPHVGYFTENNKPKTYSKPVLYDLLFNPRQGYDQQSSRCDRISQHTARKTLHIEESERIIPVRVNSTYGKRNIDLNGEPFVSHNKKNVCKEFFVRKNLNLKPEIGLLVKFNKFVSI